jgi:hypothetical protein
MNKKGKKDQNLDQSVKVIGEIKIKNCKKI